MALHRFSSMELAMERPEGLSIARPPSNNLENLAGSQQKLSSSAEMRWSQ